MKTILALLASALRMTPATSPVALGPAIDGGAAPFECTCLRW